MPPPSAVVVVVDAVGWGLAHHIACHSDMRVVPAPPVRWYTVVVTSGPAAQLVRVRVRGRGRGRG